ncbi:MAG: TIM barrel protein [Sneathiella sp.]|nr:TIM barrel protein [Sneathiella sp.]
MIKLAANLSFLYQSVDFPERFALAARDGFKGVEYLFPYDWDAADLKRILDDNGLSQILFNVWPGNWDTGERGLASLAGREKDFEETVSQALDYAAELDCKRLHVLSGLRDTNLSFDQQKAVFSKNLARAAAKAEPYGIDLLIEPINTQDMPDYYLSDVDMAADIIHQLNRPNVGLQFDIYHCQKIHGDITKYFLKYQPIIKHIQIANPPGRNEPDKGEINFPYLFEEITKAKYSGWIGCEYIPSSSKSSTLNWARSHLHAKYLHD